MANVRERPPFHIEPDPDDIHVECDKQIAALTAALESITDLLTQPSDFSPASAVIRVHQIAQAALDAARGA